MFLVKCKCGSIFTLTADGVKNTKINCPNCRKNIPFTVYTSLYDNDGLSESTEYIRCIPDDAKISVTFDV